MKLALIITISLLGCTTGSHRSVSHSSDERESQLEDLFDAKFAATVPLLDSTTGWFSNTDCDGTLWAGLSCAVGLATNIDLAEYSPGEIHRRPPPSCWNSKDGDVGSKSTVSGDMLDGYLWCRWSKGDLEALERLAAFGEANSWVMGQPLSEASRVIMRPNQVGLLGRAIFSLSAGHDAKDYRELGEVYLPVDPGYEQHLQVLGILLQGEVTEDLPVSPALLEINDQMFDRLTELAASDPKNPLFAAALGTYTRDFDAALTLLLDPATPTPAYVRGDNQEALNNIAWLFAAQIVISRYHGEER